MTPISNIRVSSERFLELVEKSQLVGADDVRRVRASLRDSLTGMIVEDPQQAAAAFVDAKLLTQWQANMLLRGKHKGFHLGKYRLLDVIGSGGMSRVYLAEHTLMRRRVAIKVLPPARVDDSSYLGRFRREAEAVAQLDHPNIVRAFDIDQQDNTHYFVMEYIDGRDFLQLVQQEGPLEYRRAAEYIAQVADALHHAHQAGLIHRDIKPGNCLVERGGNVKLLDLGLAKFIQDSGPSLTLMHDENVLGTADYLAPEQARNSHTVDHRADIYSLGCTFYFLLTGHAPFPTGSLSERLVKHQTAEPADIRLDRPDVPQELIDICSQMMHKSPDRRFPNSGEVAARLRAWLDAKTPSGEARGGPFGDVWRKAAQSPRRSPKSAPRQTASSPVPRQAANGHSKRRTASTPASTSSGRPAGKKAAPAPAATSLLRGDSVSSPQTPYVAAPDIPKLPHLPAIDVDLSGNHDWEAGSRYLPRRTTMSVEPRIWMWTAVTAAIALVAVVIGAILWSG